MPSLTTVLDRLRSAEPDFRRHGVTRLAVFGSTVRGEATDASDVDLVIDVDPDCRFSLVDLSALKIRSEELLKAPVDILLRRSLKERMKRRVDVEGVNVFG